MPVLTDRTTQLARAACAAHFDELGAHHTANRFREGKRDDCPYLDVARRAVELATAGDIPPLDELVRMDEETLQKLRARACTARPKIADGPHEVQALFVDDVPVISAPYGVTADGRPRDLDECD